jgi:hypothetical protein
MVERNDEELITDSVPEADALEQAESATDDEPEDSLEDLGELAPDVPEADALDQAREVGIDDDFRDE